MCSLSFLCRPGLSQYYLVLNTIPGFHTNTNTSATDQLLTDWPIRTYLNNQIYWKNHIILIYFGNSSDGENDLPLVNISPFVSCTHIIVLIIITVWFRFHISGWVISTNKLRKFKKLNSFKAFGQQIVFISFWLCLTLTSGFFVFITVLPILYEIPIRLWDCKNMALKYYAWEWEMSGWLGREESAGREIMEIWYLHKFFYNLIIWLLRDIYRGRII